MHMQLDNKNLTESEESVAKYQCPECSFKINNLQIYENHRKRSHKNIAKCTYCDFKTLTKGHLKVHLKKIHRRLYNEPKYQCPECSHKTNILQIYENHRKCSHKNISKCPFCDFKTLLTAHLTIHMKKMHRQSYIKSLKKYEKDSPKYQCHECSYQTKHPLLFKYHKKCSHANLLKCTHCNYKTLTARLLNVHMKKMHKNVNNDQKHQCPECSFKTHILPAYENHRKCSHENISKCSYCDYKCITTGHLTAHMNKMHHDLYLSTLKEIWYTCDKCDYQINVKSSMNLHSRKNHDNLLKCSYCDYKVISLALIRWHIQMKHPNCAESFKVVSGKVGESDTPVMNSDESYNTVMVTENNDMTSEAKNEPLGLGPDNSQNESWDVMSESTVDFEKEQKLNIVKTSELEQHPPSSPKELESNSKYVSTTGDSIPKKKNRQSNVKDTWYKCDKCDYLAKRKQLVVIHQRHNHDKLMKCSYCDCKVISLDLLIRHFGLKHPEATVRFRIVPGKVNKADVTFKNSDESKITTAKERENDAESNGPSTSSNSDNEQKNSSNVKLETNKPNSDLLADQNYKVELEPNLEMSLKQEQPSPQPNCENNDITIEMEANSLITTSMIKVETDCKQEIEEVLENSTAGSSQQKHSQHNDPACIISDPEPNQQMSLFNALQYLSEDANMKQVKKSKDIECVEIDSDPESPTSEQVSRIESLSDALQYLSEDTSKEQNNKTKDIECINIDLEPEPSIPEQDIKIETIDILSEHELLNPEQQKKIETIDIDSEHEILNTEQDSEIETIDIDSETVYINPNQDSIEQNCDFKAKSDNLLTNHVRQTHGKDEKRMKCTKCDYQTKSESIMLSHLKKSHDKLIKCSFCDYSGITTTQMGAHIKHDHKELLVGL